MNGIRALHTIFIPPILIQKPIITLEVHGPSPHLIHDPIPLVACVRSFGEER